MREPEILPEPRLYSAAGAARVMGRSHNWVAAHAVELGGFQENPGPGGRWYIPEEGIRAYYARQSERMQRIARMRVVS